MAFVTPHARLPEGEQIPPEQLTPSHAIGASVRLAEDARTMPTNQVSAVGVTRKVSRQCTRRAENPLSPGTASSGNWVGSAGRRRAN